MDFSWTDEQLELKSAVKTFAARELNDGLLERDRTGELARENWRKCARFGILGLPFPEQYGGSDADVLTTMLTMEGLGYGCRDNGLIFAMNAQMWSVQMPIFTHGSEEQKQKYLPPMCSGQTFCWPWVSGVIDSTALASQCWTGREAGLSTPTL